MTVKELQIRKALSSDDQDIFIWRNDSDSRKNSITTHKISKSEHQEWFRKKLSSKDTDIYIGYQLNTKIGVVRIEKQHDNSAEINITINPSQRNKGYGTELLSKAIKISFNKYDILTARIKKSNFASIKMFEKVGFHKKGEDDNILLYQINKEKYIIEDFE
jgi:RimJ/RimL family protein N-acetyltransferase